MNTQAPRFSPFVEAAVRIGSHDGPALLFDWFYSGRLSGGELAEAVPYAWSSAHLPFLALGAKTWIELFTATGYTADGRPAERPHEALTLYRAAEPRFTHRLAWTGSLTIAERFLDINRARYGDRVRHVYTITADPDRVLAHITDRGEDEYIVNTRGLRAKRAHTSREQA